MKKIFKNYKSSIILLCSIIIGTIIGLIFGDKASILSPLGDLFINLLLVIIVPLIFLTLTTSIVGLITTKAFTLVDLKDSSAIKEILNEEFGVAGESVNYLDKTISMISVSDFSLLLTRNNMIALIVFSILFGISINTSKDKGKKLLEVLDSANEVVQSFIKLIMLLL